MINLNIIELVSLIWIIFVNLRFTVCNKYETPRQLRVLIACMDGLGPARLLQWTFESSTLSSDEDSPPTYLQHHLAMKSVNFLVSPHFPMRPVSTFPNPSTDEASELHRLTSFSNEACVNVSYPISWWNQ